MTSDKNKKSEKGSESKKMTGEQQRPEWANGLRQLYDSVVEEPLPDSFKDLLAKLDKKS